MQILQCIVPILSDLFLARIKIKLELQLEDRSVIKKVFRYVDNEVPFLESKSGEFCGDSLDVPELFTRFPQLLEVTHQMMQKHWCTS